MKQLKVIELAAVLAGPAAGMFFAELGAEVIKIENKATGGDVTRQWKLPTEDPQANPSAYYCSVNYHKQVLMKDLKKETDRQEVLGLIAGADIVISNFKPSSAQKLGMDYESVRVLNPKLIYGQILAFDDDPTRPAFDVVLQAETGFLYMCGEPGRDPVKMPVALIDLLAAHQLKEGILLALLQRERNGKGAYVETSLVESALASLANQATNWLMANHIPQPMGTQHPNIAPYGDLFITKDNKKLILAAGTQRHFERLCSCLGVEKLLTDPRFQTNQDRLRNRPALREALAVAFSLETREHWITQLTKAGVPAGAVRTMPEVFELPTAQRMILKEELQDGRISKRLKTVAFRLLGD